MRTATIRSHSPGLLLATVLLLGGALLFGGCRGSGTSGPGASPATSPAGASTSPSTLAQTGTEEAARELLVQFVKPGADTAALTKTLMPTDADYLAVFDESSVTGAREHYAKMWSSMGSGIAPKDGQTEVILTSGHHERLQDRNGQGPGVSGRLEACGAPTEGWRDLVPVSSS